MEEELKRILEEFELSIAKIHLVGTISSNLFVDFPKSLPNNILEEWKNKIDEISKDFEDGRDENEYDFENYGFLDSLKPIIINPKESKPDFEQVIFRQNLISYLAYLEAFFQDLSKIVYKKNPHWISPDKEIKWKEIVDKGSFDSIVDYLIDKHLEKSGYNKLTDQIIKFNSKPYQLKIKLKKESLENLENLILVRNLIIHNGTKITLDYIKHNNLDDTTLNQKLTLSKIDLDKAHILMKKVAFQCYEAVRIKLFKE